MFKNRETREAECVSIRRRWKALGVGPFPAKTRMYAYMLHGEKAEGVVPWKSRAVRFRFDPRVGRPAHVEIA